MPTVCVYRFFLWMHRWKYLATGAAGCSWQDVEGERFLVDLKSTHGTFLESKRLKPHEPVKWPEGMAGPGWLGSIGIS